MHSAPTLCFVDVAAVRIQTWLVRSPGLRPRRGASNALAWHTSKDEVERALGAWSGEPDMPAGLRWNDQGGEISGVVSLCFPVTGMADLRAHALAVAAAVARHLRTHMPALPLHASYGIGTNYLSAYTDAERRVAAEGRLLDLPTACMDYSPAKPCDICRRSAASSDLGEVDGHQVCLDCHERFNQAGRQRHRNDLPMSQRDLLDRMRALDLDLERLAEDYDEVARGGSQGKGDAATQVATIFADGNRVGQLMGRLATGTGGDRASAVVLSTTAEN